MFPFSYDHTFIFKTKKEFIFSRIHNEFKAELDNVKIYSSNKFSFEGFNFFLKRHQWLDDGGIHVEIFDTEIKINLTLNFHISSIFIIAISVLLLAIQHNNILFGVFSIAATWLLFILIRLWTIVMYTLSIKRILNQLISN